MLGEGEDARPVRPALVGCERKGVCVAMDMTVGDADIEPI